MKNSRREMMEYCPFASGVFQVPVRDESRALFRHQVLLQDYEELLKETEAKKRKLHKAIKKKLQLKAEVKFLRRKYKSFTKKPAKKTPFRLEKQSQRLPHSSVEVAQSRKAVNQIEFSVEDTKPEVKDAAVLKACVLMDLNQISFSSDEEMQEPPTEWQPSMASKLKDLPKVVDAMANDFDLSGVRDVGNGSSKIDERRISWPQSYSPLLIDNGQNFQMATAMVRERRLNEELRAALAKYKNIGAT